MGSQSDGLWLGGFIRPRRLRETPRLRELVAETRIHRDQLIMPHFVVEDAAMAGPIAGLPGLSRMTIEDLVKQCESDLKLGIRAVLLFGLPQAKDESGAVAADPVGIVPQAVRMLKAAFGQDLLVITDVCQCAYLSHGHCGFPDATGHIVNDSSAASIARIALAHAQAGADIVAPSDMMDGRIGAIRMLLEDEDLSHVPIMSYAVKFASAYYGPFRDAAGSAPGFGDRRSYQLDPRNGRQGLIEAALDEAEGADILMVKPALAYLDVIAGVRARTDLPVAAYNVSGEYTMVHLLAREGFADPIQLAMEHLHAMSRAGASIFITYHARELLAAGAI